MKAELEPILFPEGQALFSQRIDLPRFNHPLHHHPEIEVVWFERRSGRYMIGDAVGGFREGELFVLGSELPHLFANSAGSDDGNAVAEVLQFRPELLESEGLGSRELAGVRDLLDRAAGGLRYAPEESMGEWMAAMREAEGLGRWIAFFRFWEALLAREVPEPLAGPEFAVRGAPLRSERIQQVCSYLLSHFQEEIRLEDMARMAHYSPAAFSRCFKQATRRTLTDFLTALRLGHACTLLRETDWPVLRISLESGFQNLSNFNRRFRNGYGMSPRDYRKINRG